MEGGGWRVEGGGWRVLGRQIRDCKRDINTVGLNAIETINRATWRKEINSQTGDPT